MTGMQEPGIVQRVEQLLGVRLEPWQAEVLVAYFDRGQRVFVTRPKRGDWVTTQLLIKFAQTLQQHDEHRRAAWRLWENTAGRQTNDGKLAQAWVAAKLEHLARYGCPGPTGRPCVHDEQQAWSP